MRRRMFGRKRVRKFTTTDVVPDDFKTDDNGPGWELPDVEDYDSGCGSKAAEGNGG